MSDVKYTACEKHNIKSKEDIEFLIAWNKVLFVLYPEARGRVNSISIKLTGRFIGIDQADFMDVCVVEK